MAHSCGTMASVEPAEFGWAIAPRIQLVARRMAATSLCGLSRPIVRGRGTGARSVGLGGLDSLGQPPILAAMIPVTMTEVMVTVAKPATTMRGRISASMALTSSSVSPTALAAS